MPEDDDQDPGANDVHREKPKHETSADDDVDETRAGSAEVHQWFDDLEEDIRREQEAEKEDEMAKSDEQEVDKEEDDEEDGISEETRAIIENGGWRMGLSVSPEIL